MIQKIFLALLTLILFSCSKEQSYSPIQMFQLAYEFDKSIEEVRITDPSRSIKCHTYPEGCIPNSPKRFKVRLVELIVIQYKSEALACAAAKKLGQYYTRNWLFDDVKGEPVLESFVKQVYDAKSPDECP